MLKKRSDGMRLLRKAERQRDALSKKRPPRSTRNTEPDVESGSKPGTSSE